MQVRLVAHYDVPASELDEDGHWQLPSRLKLHAELQELGFDDITFQGDPHAGEVSSTT